MLPNPPQVCPAIEQLAAQVEALWTSILTGEDFGLLDLEPVRPWRVSVGLLPLGGLGVHVRADAVFALCSPLCRPPPAEARLARRLPLHPPAVRLPSPCCAALQLP